MYGTFILVPSSLLPMLINGYLYYYILKLPSVLTHHFRTVAFREVAKSWDRSTKGCRCPNPKLSSEMLSNNPTMLSLPFWRDNSLGIFNRIVLWTYCIVFTKATEQMLPGMGFQKLVRRNTVMDQPRRSVQLMCFANLGLFSKWVYWFLFFPSL